MSENGMKEPRRRLRYSRHLRREGKAVSPVVATLILILIAVAAAAALYLFIVAWQGSVTKTIGTPGAQYTVTIGGSTSVYPFAVLAATQFEQNNSGTAIQVNQGGSGAGMAAVCSGQIDIGEASAFETTLQSQYGCPDTAVYQIVAYDGVDPIVSTSNTHGFAPGSTAGNLSWDTLQAIYVDASSTAPTSGISSSDGYLQGSFHMDGFLAPVQPTQGTGYTWNEIPLCAAPALNVCGPYTTATVGAPAIEPNSATTTAGAATFTVTPSTGQSCTAATTEAGVLTYAFANQQIALSVPALGAGAFALGTGCTTAPTSYTYSTPTITGQSYSGGTLTVDISFTETPTGGAGTTTTGAAATTPGDAQVTYYGIGTGVGTGTVSGSAIVDSGTGVSPCGFTVCAGGSNVAINTVTRSDVSGTQQSFIARLLAVGTPNSDIGTTGGTLAVGFSGCGGDNQWDGCGMTEPSAYAEDGNPAVISTVGSNPNAIGFASDGLVQSSTVVTPVAFQGFSQSVVVTLANGKALAAIATGISDYDSSNALYSSTQAYIGWRPFLNVETAPPSGEVLRYLEFVMDPANNQNLAVEASEISVYNSALLSGKVPVTPVEGVSTV